MFERIKSWIFGSENGEEREKETEEVEEEKPEEVEKEPKEVAGGEAGEGEIDYRNLSEKTISDIKKRDGEAELDYEKLLKAEKANKNRKTLVEWLENKIEGN